MTTPYIGEIQIFGFGFAPPDWALCDGSLVSRQQFPGLFTLIGTTYGGDGVDKFRLPNLAGRAACGAGTGVVAVDVKKQTTATLSPRKLGDSFGVNSVTLAAEHIPAHGHGLNVYAPKSSVDKLPLPKAGYSLTTPESGTMYFIALPPVVLTPATMATQVGAAGGDENGAAVAHENRQPFLALNFYIALKGQMPSFG